jgi:hypothetical protein
LVSSSCNEACDSKGSKAWPSYLTVSKMNPYIEEEQTTQWSNEKVQKDKQRLTKHTHIQA